ncbi:MAG: hypothetical protein M5U14_20265 [Acidimicrobiia bacterium]|nr:hypothetical protein [Acidimicrobiia bacterium]
MFDAPPVFHIGDSIELVVPLEYIGGWHEGSADGTVTPVGYDRGTEVLDVFAWGLGPLVGIDVPNDLTRNDYVHCSVAPGRGSVKVVAAGLFADDGPLVSVALATAAEAQVSCSDPVGTFGFPPFVTDVEELLETGIPEATDVGLFLQGWEHPGGGSPWATKEIHHQLSEEGVTLTIGWHFTIEHAPGELPPPRDTSPG